MAKYDTAANIIISAAIECGLSPAADPYASTSDEMVQMRNLLTNCGQELLAAYQWEQLVRLHTIDTGATPPADGRYDLPSDFNYMINQTGWTPANVGMGLPLGGPMSEQTWAGVVASNLASSTIYVSFKISDGVLQFLPAPAPINIDITFYYMSRGWVDLLGAGTTFDDTPTDPTDIILYDRMMMVKMLAARYKQAKGLDAGSSLEQFETAYASITSINTPAPVLYAAGWRGFPYLNMYTNVPQSGYGS